MRKLGSQRLTHLPEVTARVVPELMLLVTLFPGACLLSSLEYDLMSSNKPSTALLGILFTSSAYSFDGEGAG